MKKNCLLIILLSVGVILLSDFAYAQFIIKLKSGREIYTEAYQDEGKHVVVYLKAGTLKISKGDILSITQIKEKRVVEEEEVKVEKKEEKVEKVTTEEKKETVEKKEVKKEEAAAKPGKDPNFTDAEIEQYKKRKKETQARLDEAKKVYFDTIDKEEKNKARRIMLSIANEMSNLQEEVKKKNNGIIPKWWQEE